MSAALVRLRKMVGDPLLVRVGREFELTPLARNLSGPLRTSLASLEATVERRAEFDPRTSTRQFSIAASDHVFYSIARPLLQHLSNVAPGVRLHLRGLDANTARKLASGRIDLSIQPSGMMSDFPAAVLFDETWVCAAWSGNDQVSDPMTMQEWSALPHACFALGHTGILLADLLLGPLVEVRQRRVTSDSFLTLPLLLPNTQLIAMLPSRVASLYARATGIRLCKPPKALPGWSETMTWNANSESDPAHAWLRQQLKLIGAAQANSATDADAR
jgi:DNA-binding transcriptional LysR family regulator